MPLVQSNSGTNDGVTNITPTLPGATTAGNTIIIKVSSAGTLSTPSGFVSRSPQVNIQGCYHFDKLVASGNSSDLPTMVQGGAFNAIWIVEEWSGITAFKTSNGANSGFSGGGSFSTGTVTPSAGATLFSAYMGVSASSTPDTFAAGDPQSWTNSFTGTVSLARTGSAGSGRDSMVGGSATFQATADGSTAYSTAATFTPSGNGAPHLIIAAYAISAPSTQALTGAVKAATSLKAAGLDGRAALSGNASVEVASRNNIVAQSVTTSQPVLVAATQSAFSTAASKTASGISVQNGDVLVAHGMMGASTADQISIIATTAGSTVAWTLLADLPGVADGGQPYLRTWSTTASAAGTVTVTFSRSPDSVVTVASSRSTETRQALAR
jgi:hypothetical protein